MYSSAQLALCETPFWFCLKAQPKREHLAAIGLNRQLKIECFSPRLRFRKLTTRGTMWFVEAMFPGYLFARFNYSEQHRWVESSPGIQRIVQFGDQVATLNSDIIDGLRQSAGAEEIVTIDPKIEVGQSVQIAEGPLQGMEALVVRLLPAKERIRVLLSFLGRSVETEIPTPKVLSLTPSRP
jgi:transcriptional antiterminator RfaH